MGKPADRVAEKSRKYIITDDYGSKIDSIVLQCEGVAIAEKARFAKLLPQVYDRSPACTRVFQAYFSFLCAERTRHLRDIGPAKPPGPVEAEELRSCLKWCKRQLGQPNVKLAAKHREEVARLVPLIEARLGELGDVEPIASGRLARPLVESDFTQMELHMQALALADTKVGREGVEAHRRKEEEQVAARVRGEVGKDASRQAGKPINFSRQVPTFEREGSKVLPPRPTEADAKFSAAFLPESCGGLGSASLYRQDPAFDVSTAPRTSYVVAERMNAADRERAVSEARAAGHEVVEVQDSVVVVTKKTSDRGGVLL